jgi:glycosyltransferase involved in cell wall biosynthesis
MFENALCSQSRMSAPSPLCWSLLILSRHARQAASSRLRTYQYIPFLKARGARVTSMPFFDEPYLDRFYRSGSRGVFDVLRAYLRRVSTVPSIRRASVVWIEKEIFPFMPGFIESLPSRLGVRYVVDYDDATFHTYDNNSSPLVRGLLANKLDNLLRGARAVTAGNAYLETYAHARGARSVERVPTVVDLDRYAVRPEPPDNEIRIGWIGTPATTRYLELLRTPLRDVARVRKIRLVTVGAAPLDDFGIPIERHAWSADTEAEILSSLHIGVMPLRDELWERGKCGYKLIQYMASGRPVIASPVGVNTDIVTPDTGILAGDAASWSAALIRLIDDAALRQRLGAAGRKLVETSYSLEIMAPKVCAMLSSIAFER